MGPCSMHKPNVHGSFTNPATCHSALMLGVSTRARMEGASSKQQTARAMHSVGTHSSTCLCHRVSMLLSLCSVASLLGMQSKDMRVLSWLILAEVLDNNSFGPSRQMQSLSKTCKAYVRFGSCLWGSKQQRIRLCEQCRCHGAVKTAVAVHVGQYGCCRRPQCSACWPRAQHKS